MRPRDLLNVCSDDSGKPRSDDQITDIMKRCVRGKLTREHMVALCSAVAEVESDPDKLVTGSKTRNAAAAVEAIKHGTAKKVIAALKAELAVYDETRQRGRALAEQIAAKGALSDDLRETDTQLLIAARDVLRDELLAANGRPVLEALNALISARTFADRHGVAALTEAARALGIAGPDKSISLTEVKVPSKAVLG